MTYCDGGRTQGKNCFQDKCVVSWYYVELVRLKKRIQHTSNSTLIVHDEDHSRNTITMYVVCTKPDIYICIKSYFYISNLETCRRNVSKIGSQVYMSEQYEKSTVG